ncbi:hypothetical protein [Streptomyces sp. NPDC002550]
MSTSNHKFAPAEPTGQPSIAEEVVAAGVPACAGMGREVYPGTPSLFFAAPRSCAGRPAPAG